MLLTEDRTGWYSRDTNTINYAHAGGAMKLTVTTIIPTDDTTHVWTQVAANTWILRIPGQSHGTFGVVTALAADGGRRYAWGISIGGSHRVGAGRVQAFREAQQLTARALLNGAVSPYPNPPAV